MKEFNRTDNSRLSIVHQLSSMICRHPLGPINHAYGPDIVSGMDRLSPGVSERDASWDIQAKALNELIYMI